MKKYCKKFILLFLFLAIVLFGVEVILRFSPNFYINHIGNSEPWPPGMFMEDKKLGFKLKPNFSGFYYRKFKDRKFKIRYHINTNSFGLRDKEIALFKESGEKRILCLGDSFTQAIEVDLCNTFCKVIEKKINYVESQNKIRVINAGVLGWGLYQELHYLKNMGFKFLPDIVLVNIWVGDDIFQSKIPTMSLHKRDVQHVDYEGSYVIKLIKDFFCKLRDYRQKFRSVKDNGTKKFYFRFEDIFLKTNSHLEDLKRKQYLRIDGQLYAGLYLMQKKYPKIMQENWNVFFEIIKEMIGFADKLDFKIVFIIIPTKEQVNDWGALDNLINYSNIDKNNFEINKPQIILGGFLKKHEVLYLDLLPVLEKVKREFPTCHLFFHGCHLNEKGHKIVAQQIAKFLFENKLLNF